MISPEKLMERLRSPWEVRSLSGVSDVGTRLSEAADALQALTSQITQLTEERDRLREAMKPFATAAQEINPAVPDDAVAMNWGGQRPILMSDLRRAAAPPPSIPEKPE